jgi:hypothetical protein
VNHKRLAGKQSPGRDEQFQYLARRREAFLRRGHPVISVETKKKELVGRFKNPGQQWRQAPHDVAMADFPSTAGGEAIPYGIYEVGRNKGYVVVGVSQDTPEFAVRAIRSWWVNVGRKVYAPHRQLLIEADCGGSNGNRCHAWKVQPQAFADEFGLTITVTHYPIGASKWNPSEHRMFNLISANWSGQPLGSYETPLTHLNPTRSPTGFQCLARMDTKNYIPGRKTSKADIACLRARTPRLFPHWNFTIQPLVLKQPASRPTYDFTTP